TRRASVADQPEHIREAVSEALRRTGAVLTTGGLGPTRDDVTKKVIAELYGAPLDFDESVWSDLLARFARLQRSPPESNRVQAEVPRGAVVLKNLWGTAPGLWLEGGPGLTIVLPGVPSEMRKLLEHEVVPRLTAKASGTVIRSHLVRTTGIPESLLAERLGQVEEEIAPVTLAYLPGLEGVDLRLSAWQLSAEDADRKLRSAVNIVKARAGECVYADGDHDLAALVLEAARLQRIRLAVAESCTGGLLGARLTEIAGSSDVFIGGVIAYDNAVKREALEVPAALIEEHGAVSEPTVRAMAEGVARRLGAEAVLAVTGIAGPGGGSEAKPVGTVWLASLLRGRIESRRLLLPGSRHEIRARAVQGALHLLFRQLRPARPS
ncbi:MAG TPA: CinA family nicotinamide mononucleotide deamidase-related protein, partial [Actinomycetota bacterium]|nr:CinA family nicotinamide mononucleotide deamidase-related protein [Actinomycetota bacterium]